VLVEFFKRLGMIVGCLLLVVMTGVLTMRVSILMMLVLTILVLAWTSVRQPALLATRCAKVLALTLALAVLPMDLRVEPTGALGVGAARVAWGYPGPATRQRASRGDVRLGGCIVGLNPPAFLLEITY
jgi:hypothetical protein